MKLAEELKQITADAAARRGSSEADKKKARLANEIKRDLKDAKNLIARLPGLLRHGAESGGHMKIMTLTPGFHCLDDADDVMTDYETEGRITEDIVKHGAFKVAEWLTRRGLRVVLEKEQHTDEGQGYVWYRVILVARWGK